MGIQSSMQTTVKQNEERRRFEAEVDGAVAVLDYQQKGKRLALTHTEVPEQLSGRGIGGRLAQFALDYAREHGLEVAPDCPFVAGYIERHPEYQELVVA